MRYRLLLLAVLLLSACSGPDCDVLAVGREEAARLRECYKASPEKHRNGFMRITSASLSLSARAAGFKAALVDCDSEMLIMASDESFAEGFLFDYVSGAQLWDLEDSGYSFSPTNEWDILHFVYRRKKSPNLRPDGTLVEPPSSNPGQVSGVPHP